MSTARRDAARFEAAVRADLAARRWLRWHAFLFGTCCFVVTWALSAGLLNVGVRSMALRWAVVLAVGYVVFLGLLWVWCRWLISREEADGDPGSFGDFVPDGGGGGGDAVPPFRSGGGGDFGGGGASGDWSAGADTVAEGAGDAAKATLELAAAADEGIVVAVPLAVVVGVAALIAGGLGLAVFGLFGVEVLVGVAVEIAFASAGGALAFRARREGWLAHAFGRTVWPAVLVFVLVVGTGAAIDRWVPQADSLPQAVRALGGG